jgi:hypothetical protein
MQVRVNSAGCGGKTDRRVKNAANACDAIIRKTRISRVRYENFKDKTLHSVINWHQVRWGGTYWRSSERGIPLRGLYARRTVDASCYHLVFGFAFGIGIDFAFSTSIPIASTSTSRHERVFRPEMMKMGSWHGRGRLLSRDLPTTSGDCRAGFVPAELGRRESIPPYDAIPTLSGDFRSSTSTFETRWGSGRSTIYRNLFLGENHNILDMHLTATPLYENLPRIGTRPANVV